MVFSDKLKMLMSLTHTSNKALAKDLIVDPSMISQLRTGARNITKKNNHLRNMSDYFAKRCNTPSRIIELQDYIDDYNLNSDCTVTELSDIIFRFLSEEDSRSNSSKQVISEVFKANPRTHKTELKPLIPNKSLMVCHNLEEKKLYLQHLFEYYMASDTTGVIYFSSEEVVDWIYEDKEFYNNFRSWCITLIEKGFSFIRIMKPIENREHFLQNILLWLPIYLTGDVHLFYYPHYRDDVFRQTIVTMDNSASYFSSSIARTETCYYSFMSTNPSLSVAYVRQIKDYLSLCRPSMDICKSETDISSAFTKIMSATGDRITKSYDLSPESIPYDEMLEYMGNSDNEELKAAAKTVKRMYKHTDIDNSQSTIIDMSTIANFDDIMNGKVRLRLPGYVNHKELFYTPELYAMHLRYIINRLEANSNYHFYPIEPSSFGEYNSDYSPISVIDNYGAITVSENAVLYFTQPEIIRTLYEHLYTQTRTLSKYHRNRKQITEMLQKLLNKIEERL
jgi:hypothetical protein